MEPCLNEATIMQCDMETFLTASHSAGFRCVELVSQKVEEYLANWPHQRLKDVLQQLEIRAVGLDGLEFFSLVPEENYAVMLKRAEYQLFLCQLLEIRYLVLVPSMMQGEMAPKTILDKTAKTVRLISEIAKEMKVEVALEIVGNKKFSLRKIDQGLRVLKEVQDDSVFLALDNVCLYEGDNETGELEKIPIERIALVHANDVRKKPVKDYSLQERVFPGEGDLELREFYSILKKRGYRGPVSVEIFNEDIWGKTPNEAAQNAWRSIQSFLT